MPQNSQETLERDLQTKGCGYAPNGARYLLSHYGSNDQPCCERTHEGQREIILGFASIPFGSLDDSRRWAEMDCKYEMKPGEPLNNRRCLV